jgi:CubicO group peptidase (beta-lactamase class C family)
VDPDGAAAYVDGELVLDDPGPVANTFSVTKPFAAMCVLLLVDRGKVGLDDAVEIPAGATVRQVLSHQAGLVALREPQPLETALDWDRAIAALRAEEPWWQPGTAAGEHALWYGHLVGDIVMRADGRTLGAFFREEIAQPLGLDFEIGVTDESRIADLTASGGWREEMLAGVSDLYRLAVDNPRCLRDLDVLNSSEWRRAEIPAVNGHGDARSVARFYDALLRGELISDDLLAEATRPQWTGTDVLLEDERSWGLGFAVEPDGFGMGGIGGSLGWADPERGLAFGFVTAALGDHDRAESALLGLFR